MIYEFHKKITSFHKVFFYIYSRKTEILFSCKMLLQLSLLNLQFQKVNLPVLGHCLLSFYRKKMHLGHCKIYFMLHGINSHTSLERHYSE